MKHFTGNVEWIHQWEGHAGKPYFPGDPNKAKHVGVTLDPGVDLGHVDHRLVEDNYFHLFTDNQKRAIQSVYGLRGIEAAAALDKNVDLQSIRISRAFAKEVFPVVAKPYWENISSRFPSLKEDDVPGAVQTVLLSLAYNRGPHNRHLGVLKETLQNHDWEQLASQVESMQQDHPLRFIRKRRRAEGKLIREYLKTNRHRWREWVAQDLQSMKIKPLELM